MQLLNQGKQLMAFFISGQLGVVYYLLYQTDPCCQIGRVTAFASEVIGGDHLRTKYVLEKVGQLSSKRHNGT